MKWSMVIRTCSGAGAEKTATWSTGCLEKDFTQSNRLIPNPVIMFFNIFYKHNFTEKQE